MSSNIYQIKLPWVGTNEFEHESWNDCEMFENIEHFNFDKKLTRYSKRFNSIELDIPFTALRSIIPALLTAFADPKCESSALRRENPIPSI